MDGRPPPRYLRVADDIAARIADGEFPAGSRLPRETVLASDYEVSYSTVRRAMGVLRDRGLVVTEWGVGNIVRSPDDGA